MLRACVGGRTEGPLLRSRRTFSAGPDLFPTTSEDLKARFDAKLLSAKPGAVQTAHDRKHLFRRMLGELGV